MEKLKLLIAYHKMDIIFKNSFLEPIQVGRTLAKQKSQTNNDIYGAMIGDDTGDNISAKNHSYNEMTAVYWAWKNYEKLGNPKFIGLEHYRRHFVFKDLPKAYYECNDFLSVEDYLTNKLNCNEATIEAVLNDYDFIAPMPYYKTSVYNHYKENHHIADLDIAIKIVKKLFPDYTDSCNKYINGHFCYFCNMFIFPKNIFFRYADFIFSILTEFEKEVDITDKRLFISERLTGIFIQKLLDEKKRGKFFPTMYIEEAVTIPVCFASDKNYFLPTAVAITSLLANANKTTSYKIYLLTSENEVDDAKNFLTPVINKFNNAKLLFIPMGKQFDDLKINIPHISRSTYYRLMLPSLLPNIDKCIYLDSDIIITADLRYLYRTNLDEYLVAGVKAAGYYYPKEHVKEHLSATGIPAMDQYINAGVLLMNLKKMRKIDCMTNFMAVAKKGLPSQDQDVINLVCYNQIRILPLENNLMTKYLRQNNNNISIIDPAKSVYSPNEIDIALKNPLIIHYADKIKPWVNSNVVFSNIWFDYYYKFSAKNTSVHHKVGIILPIFNQEDYLSQCLDSILSQSFKDISIICINDGSTDISLSLLLNYAQKDDRFVIYNQPNSGVAIARNKGIELSDTDYIMFMDPDDFYPSDNIIEKLYNLTQTQNVQIAGGSWSELYNNKIKTTFINYYTGYTFKQEGLMQYSDYQFDFGYHRFIYSKKLIVSHNIRFPNYRRFQDPPFFIKAMTTAKKFYAIPELTYCYRIGHQNIPSSWSDEKFKDLLLGLIDELRISKRNNLAKLHYIAFRHLNDEYNTMLSIRVKKNTSPYLLELLIRANSEIDRQLIRNFDSRINENYLINPLRESIYYFSRQNAKLQTEINNIKNKRLYKLYKLYFGFFRCLKQHGFKYTMHRVKLRLLKKNDKH